MPFFRNQKFLSLYNGEEMKEKKEKFVKQKNSIRKQGKLIIRVLHLSSFFFISTFFSLLATGDYQARQHSLSLSAKGSARKPSKPRCTLL